MSYKSDYGRWSNSFLHEEIQLFLTLTDTMLRFKGHFYKWVTGPICFLSALLLMDAVASWLVQIQKKDIWSHKEIQRSWWVQPLNRTICPPFSLIAFSTCGRFQGSDWKGQVYLLFGSKYGLTSHQYKCQNDQRIYIEIQ